ncbi:helix-turn-helix domain-containing protein [Rhodococcus sp. BS-15]|uniref:helix-turn-helix domain-containing protein n=1 Tax=Rhodococcus sp. BS-15 TaxID=1304954 RepID=UPI000FFC088E
MSGLTRVVVLAQANYNPSGSVKTRPDQGLLRPTTFRSRVTKRKKSDVVELYASGLSALDVAERVGIGKSTVLKILKTEGVHVRPRGVRLS